MVMMMKVVMLMMMVISVVVNLVLDTWRACLTASLVVVVVMFGIILLGDAAVVGRRSMEGPGAPQTRRNVQISEVK